MLNARLPSDPLPLFAQWFADAHKQADLPNPNAMALSSARIQEGVAYPSSRIVLVKELNLNPGYVVFYTNYQSRKSQELLGNHRACGLLHWDKLGLQVRLEGEITQSPAQESDTYFSSRDYESKLGAWTSDQSQPIASRDELLQKFAHAGERFDQHETIPRPPHWGGYRLWINHLELWSAGAHRLHDRALWKRPITVRDNHATVGAWTVTRLQP